MIRPHENLHRHAELFELLLNLYEALLIFRNSIEKKIYLLTALTFLEDDACTWCISYNIDISLRILFTA